MLVPGTSGSRNQVSSMQWGKPKVSRRAASGIGVWTKKKKTPLIFHDLDLEIWGNIISSRKKALNLFS